MLEDLETVKRTIKDKEVGLLGVLKELTKYKEDTEKLQKEKTKLQEFGKKKKVELENKEKEFKEKLDKNKNEMKVSLEEKQYNFNSQIDEKNKEISEMLESLAKCEEEIKEYETKLNKAEQLRRDESELHMKKLRALESQLTAVGEDKESSLQSRLDILNESHSTELKEKESEIKRLQAEIKASSDSYHDMEDRLKINLESSLKSEEEMDIKFKDMEQKLVDFNTFQTKLSEVEKYKSALEAKVKELKSGAEKQKNKMEELEKNKMAELEKVLVEKEQVFNELRQIKTTVINLEANLSSSESKNSQLSQKISEILEKTTQQNLERVSELETELETIRSNLSETESTLETKVKFSFFFLFISLDLVHYCTF